MNEKIKVTVAERTFLLTSSDEESYVQKVAESVDEQIRQAAEASHASTLDAAIMCAMNLADNFFKEQEKSEHLRQQVKQYLDEASHTNQSTQRPQRALRSLGLVHTGAERDVRTFIPRRFPRGRPCRCPERR